MLTTCLNNNSIVYVMEFQCILAWYVLTLTSATWWICIDRGISSHDSKSHTLKGWCQRTVGGPSQSVVTPIVPVGNSAYTSAVSSRLPETHNI